MKYSEEELDQLEETVEKYSIIVKDTKLLKVISSYNKFFSCFNKLFTTLNSEKILTVDPYGQEYNLKKLECPDSSPIAYNEEAYTISIRLTHYNSLLTYIKTADILDINILDPVKIDKVSKLIHYLDWNRLFDPQPIEINTEALNKVLFDYQKDRGQKYIIAALKASTSDIDKYSKEISGELESVKLYFNEKYKLWVRREVLPNVKLPPQLQGQNIKKAHDMISAKVLEFNQPLYIELIGEILKEDFTNDGDDVKKSIVARLQNGDITAPKAIKKHKEETPLQLLEKALSELSKMSSQTDSITQKLQENDEMIRDEKYSFIEKIIDYIKHILIGNKRKTYYRIKVQDSPELKVTEKELEFEKFIYSIKLLNKKLVELKNIESDLYLQFISRGEEEVQIKLHQLLSKSKYIYKNLCALNSFFKKGLNASKGIQVELKVLLSSIDKSQAIYFEYKKTQSDAQEDITYKPDINLIT